MTVTLDLALEEEKQDRIPLGLTWGDRKKWTPSQTDTDFQNIHMKSAPFVFCAHTADVAKQVTAVFLSERDDTLGHGWCIYQLPLTCLVYRACTMNPVAGMGLLLTDKIDPSCRQYLCHLDFILPLSLILTPRADWRHKSTQHKPEALPWVGS